MAEGNRLIGVAGFARSSMAFGFLRIRDTRHWISRLGSWAMYDGNNGSRHKIIFGIESGAFRDDLRARSEP